MKTVYLAKRKERLETVYLAKHKEFTGQGNDLILENAKKIGAAGANLIIRVPVIPRFNDTKEEISDIARFAAEIRGVKHIHLLPYHRLGIDKYTGLDREYTLSEILPPSNEKMLQLLDVALSSGLDAQIGG